MFTQIFENYPKTAVAGPYFSCETNPHIQSFMLAIDKRGLFFMKQVFRCPNQNEEKTSWIYDTECVS